jgi:hypothetical protein
MTIMAFFGELFEWDEKSGEKRRSGGSVLKGPRCGAFGALVQLVLG